MTTHPCNCDPGRCILGERRAHAAYYDALNSCDDTPLDFSILPYPGWRIAKRYGTPKPSLSERVRVALRNRAYRRARR